MRISSISPRRLVLAALAASAAGAMAASASGTASPVANAAPAACSASALAATASGVLSQAGGYLESHPGANSVVTAAFNQLPDEARSSMQGYFLGHPNEFLDLQNIAQPLMNLRDQCGPGLSPKQLGALADSFSG